MKIGIMVEGQEGLAWERWFAIADQVESQGLDSLWRSDHFFSVMGRTERASLENLALPMWSGIGADVQEQVVAAVREAVSLEAVR